MSLGVLRKLRVQSLRKETTEGLVVALEIPQAFRKSFGFKHGQFLTLEKKINSEIVRRPYSICSQAVSEPSSLEIGIKKIIGIKSIYPVSSICFQLICMFLVLFRNSLTAVP